VQNLEIKVAVHLRD